MVNLIVFVSAIRLKRNIEHKKEKLSYSHVKKTYKKSIQHKSQFVVRLKSY